MTGSWNPSPGSPGSTGKHTYIQAPIMLVIPIFITVVIIVKVFPPWILRKQYRWGRLLFILSVLWSLVATCLNWPLPYNAWWNDEWMCRGKKNNQALCFFPTDCDMKGICWHRNRVFGLYSGYWMGRKKKNTFFLACSGFVTVGEGPLGGKITRQPVVAGQAFTEHVRCMCINTWLVTWPGGRLLSPDDRLPFTTWHRVSKWGELR